MKMSKGPKKKLIYRLLLFVLPLIVLSAVVTGLATSYSNNKELDANLDRDYRSILSTSTNGIRFYMEDAQSSLESLARLLGASKFDSFEYEIALRSYNLKSNNYMSISLFSRDEALITSTGWSGSGESRPSQSEFDTILAGKPTISEVMLTSQKVPYLCMGIPVVKMGKVSAVLWGELNLKAVWSVIKDIDIGKTGKVFMTDLDGRVVAETDMIHVIKAASDIPPEVVNKLRKAVDAPFYWTEKDKHTKFYCIGRAIPSTPWIIVIKQTDQEVYAYFYKNFHLAFMIIAFVGLFATLTGWYLVRKFLAPIHELHDQVIRIGNGELDCRIEIKSRDEIENLGAAVNGMAKSIRAYIQREVENVRELAHARNLATLGAASSRVTHEVGNLLNNIEIILFKLKREQMSPVVEESIRTLQVEAGRVSRFIENLLQFAKKPHLRLQKISLEAVIQEVIAIYGPEAEKRNIRLELDWPAELPPVLLDASLMYQVLNNLVKNGLETGSDPSFICISGEIEANYLKITVKDDGPGIEPDVLDQIFDPFFSTKADKGTGVGLAICRTILEAHRGTIECLSKHGEYTAFILRLPLE